MRNVTLTFLFAFVFFAIINLKAQDQIIGKVLEIFGDDINSETLYLILLV